MTNAAATPDQDSLPACQSIFGRGVWFTFTPTSDGLVEVSTCGSDFDTVLQVYTGSCGSLAAVPGGCNDDDGPVCFGSPGSVHLSGTAGRTYYILAGGYAGEAGALRIQARTPPPAPNDACAAAVALAPGAPYTMDTAAASSNADPLPLCQTNFGKGVWFTFTPNSDGWVEVSTCGSNFDTVLQVYTGSCGSPSALAGDCIDDNGPACFDAQASVRFSGTGGRTYRILAGGFGGSSGSLQIQARMLSPPPNDGCSGAIALTDTIPYTVEAADATPSGELLELPPTCWTNAGNGVWFTFTPTLDGWVEVSTCGSDFGTVLQIYTGSCGSLARVPGGCNNQNGPICSGSQASVRFVGTGGSTYYILSGGHGGSSRALRIRATTLSPPPNDACAGAIALTNTIPYSLDTVSASSAGDPLPWCQTNFGKGVWFTFTPSSNAIAEVETCGSGFDTVLQVYTGACGSLVVEPAGCNDQNGPVCSGSRSSVRFSGAGGVTYYILAGGFSGASGTLHIQARTVPAPLNEACSGAIVLTPGVPYTMDTAGVQSDPEPPPTCRPNLGKGAWFTFSPDSDGLVEVSTCGSGFDSVLEVYTGSCDSLSAVAGGCHDDNGPACFGAQASVRFDGMAGATYYILAGGFLGQNGTLRIQARTLSPPANDTCSAAIALNSGVPYTLNTAGAGSDGDPLPDCQSEFGNGVWFTLTPDAAGLVDVSTCGSSFDTVLGVYSGPCGSLVAVPGRCNDEDGPVCFGAQASLRFTVTAATTYYILAGGYRGSSGALQIQATFQGECVPTPAGLVSWWPGDGDAQDIVGGHRGELRNGTSFAPGMVGPAFNFDGTNDEMRVLITAALQLTNNMTVEGWIFRALPFESDSWQVIASTLTQAAPSCTRGWMLLFDQDGRLGFLSGAGRPCPELEGTFAGRVPLDTWTHVAATVQDTGSQRVMTLSIDGEVAARFATMNSFVPSAVGQDLSIGSQTDSVQSSRQFRGQVDELSLYNRALSQAEIRAIYAAGSRGKSFSGQTAPTIRSITVQSNQTYLLQGRGAPKACYILQASTDLSNWSELTERTAAGDGSLQFSVSTASPIPVRFFRLESAQIRDSGGTPP